MHWSTRGPRRRGGLQPAATAGGPRQGASAVRRCRREPRRWGSRCAPDRRSAMPRHRAGFAALDADVAVVAAYGLILPAPMLEAPRRGCLNVHASLLPRWRGAAPIQRAILAGDETSGVTIMQMDAGLDTGPMLLARKLDIRGKDAGQVTEEMSKLGAVALVNGSRTRHRHSLSQPRARPMRRKSRRPRDFESTGADRPTRSNGRSGLLRQCRVPGSR